MGDGKNIVAGGVGDDPIETGADNDLILGDNGLFDFTTDTFGTPIVTSAQTTDTVDQPGWDDMIVTGEGDNIVLAGVGSDHVNDPATSPSAVPSAGNDIVIGDNGEVTWDIDGVIESFASTEPGFGGDDVIAVGDGTNIVVGGFGNDTITTGADIDIVLGDNGQVTYIPGTGEVQQAMTTDTANGTGGNDTIIVGDGDNLVLAGAGADSVTGGSDNDLVMGDNGVFDFTLVGGVAVLTSAQTTDITDTDALGNPLAWDDTIVTGAGDNIVMAGLGADHVNDPATSPLAVPSAGTDIVIGDNGFVNWDAGGQLTQFGSTVPELGGDDVIRSATGRTSWWAASATTPITTGAGADIVLGDDGQVDYVTADGDSTDIDSIVSTSTTGFGGTDTIITGDGDDIVIGGRFDDTIDAGDGDNLVIGDSGQITADTVDAPQMAGQPITLGLVESIQIDDGGIDTITTGTGNDIVLAGFGGDQLDHRRQATTSCSATTA